MTPSHSSLSVRVPILVALDTLDSGQSHDAQPWQPQLTHSTTLPSGRLSFGTRQMHVVP